MKNLIKFFREMNSTTDSIINLQNIIRNLEALRENTKYEHYNNTNIKTEENSPRAFEQKQYLIKEQIKKLSPDAIIPKRGTKFSACKDLYSPIDAVVPAGKNLLIKTDIAIAWDNPEYYMQILSRSGLAYKNNVVVQAGVVDVDYRANIGVLLQNNSNVDFVVKRGDRIGQYVYVKITTEESEEVNEFTIPLESDRNGGFGSTGV